MQRFYHNTDLKNVLFIEDKDFFHQISHVLRSKIGDNIILFNSTGFDYIYSISEIIKKGITLKLDRKIENNSDLKTSINLYQALPNKYEKIEYILQKGVEVGISNFTFFNTERSQKLVINDKKIERFNFIVKEALEQCGGDKLPQISFVDKIDFSEINGQKLVCHTKISGSINLSEIKNTPNEFNIFVGPEGGFSDKEIENFTKNNCSIINFGERILRTETTSSVLGFYLGQIG
ncbi:16S rRNA (uracil(1498)-N(3))-methyltransferase [Candidatus Gracilibacteria bacterium]|nr:16S rRNA (uracil(1498)-N(3))-methyltransferase [Candidatus Gracilibacteria bacterium]